MDRSRFIQGLLSDPRDPQLPQYVPENDFGPRAYGLLNSLFPDPYEATGDAIRQYRGGDPVGAFETMFGAMPTTGALKAARPATGKAPGIIAYHGSPHSFDRFDLSKIGTGEGAQAYGHGLYFAESEPVAQSYRQALQQVDTAPFDVIGVPPKNWNAARMFAQNMDPTLPDVAARDFAQWTGHEFTQELVDAFSKAKKPGSMYQVRINADPEHFLDWDKPLSEQSPVVQSVADGMKAKSFLARRALERSDASGRDIWEKSRNAFVTGAGVGNDAAASSMLREAGIPGIKYLDQGSRAAGEGSRNYVVFDDSLIDILKKYGLIGLLGGGAAASGVSGMNNQAAAPGL